MADRGSSRRGDQRGGGGARGSNDDRKHDGSGRNNDRHASDRSSRRDHTFQSSGRNDQPFSSSNRAGNMGFGGGGGGGFAPSMGMRHGGGGNMFSTPAMDLEPLVEPPKKKFTGRCRLFVGNLPPDVKEAELKELFSPHGDLSECFLSGKGFAFLRMDTRAHAESAKEAIDGKMLHGRPVRVRFAVHGAAVRVKELSPYVSNELLYQAFSIFGDVERAVHIVDEKGRPTGEGVVEFERKPSANEALRQTKDQVFLLTSNPKPLVVEPVEPRDEDDGLSERMIQRTSTMAKEREVGPRFAAPNTFELMFGQRWKELYEMEKVKREQLEAELKESRDRLEQDMELAYQDYQTHLLREDLERRQRELDRLEAAKRERMARRSEDDRMHGMHVGGMGSGRGPIQQQSPDEQQFFGTMPPRPNFGAMGPNGGQQGGDFGPFRGPSRQRMMDNGGGGPFVSGPPQQQQQQQQAGPMFQGGGRPGADPTLVQGVQKLLQMFKGNPAAGGGPGGFSDRGGPNQQMKSDIDYMGGNVGGMLNGAFNNTFTEPPGKRRRH